MMEDDDDHFWNTDWPDIANALILGRDADEIRLDNQNSVNYIDIECHAFVDVSLVVVTVELQVQS